MAATEYSIFNLVPVNDIVRDLWKPDEETRYEQKSGSDDRYVQHNRAKGTYQLKPDGFLTSGKR
jgi:hypothetical protein